MLDMNLVKEDVCWRAMQVSVVVVVDDVNVVVDQEEEEEEKEGSSGDAPRKDHNFMF